MKKTQKLNVIPPTNQHSWSDTLEEHPFVQWMTANGKIILYVIVGLFLLGIMIFRFVMGSNASSEADFITAEKEYRLFAAPSKEGNDPATQANALKTLNTILAAHPELHAKYDGSIAEILLIRGENSQASDYAVPAIQRTTQENEPFYKGYAQTTLVIADGKYEQALKESNTLKDQMIKQGQELQDTPEKIQFSTLLYALNLLRIGMLQQQLALNTDELATWKEWKDLIHKSETGALPKYLDGQLFLSFDNLLTEGEASFANYIEAREKILIKNAS